jgi:hypothetical protein
MFKYLSNLDAESVISLNTFLQKPANSVLCRRSLHGKHTKPKYFVVRYFGLFCVCVCVCCIMLCRFYDWQLRCYTVMLIKGNCVELNHFYLRERDKN